jgi:hypothetical protein
MTSCEYNIPLVCADTIYYYMRDTDIPLTRAVEDFLSSEVFACLEDTKTGLYRESPGLVYDLFRDELSNGKLIQEEI